jgi:glycerophosphoryl diester phosphodiesterase
VKIIGHRGAKGLAPENSLAGFAKALEHHVDEIEFDVRVTKDGIPILAHDPVVHTSASEELTISKHSYADLAAKQPNLCTLDQVMDFVDGRAILDIEVKPNERTKPVAAVISARLASGQYTSAQLRIASFDFKVLKRLHQALPDITMIVNERWSGVRATARAKKLGTKRITMQQLWLWRGFITMMSKSGWQLSAYTLNDTAKARRWASYGLYAVVTDVPDAFEPKASKS